MTSWLQEQITKKPKKLFIQIEDAQYSYIDIAAMVGIYSRGLMHADIKINDRIIIYLPCSIEMVELMLSCFEIGAVIVPISRRLKPIELLTHLTLQSSGTRNNKTSKSLNMTTHK